VAGGLDLRAAERIRRARREAERLVARLVAEAP
jgi:hypothetical protein